MQGGIEGHKVIICRCFPDGWMTGWLDGWWTPTCDKSQCHTFVCDQTACGSYQTLLAISTHEAKSKPSPNFQSQSKERKTEYEEDEDEDEDEAFFCGREWFMWGIKLARKPGEIVLEDNVS
ncbi:GD11490 [Drosophila simulans]|uniref:GD11490 n=1 Tax=Drosophila simulans TaxID=7240 RepID=B4QEJ2_DROSI|nr:GD11490 [Drosophila simulans]